MPDRTRSRPPARAGSPAGPRNSGGAKAPAIRAGGERTSGGRVRVVPSAVRVGLLGLGTVGQGVVQVLERNRADIERKVGRGIEIVRALVRDPSKPRPEGLPAERITGNVEEILGDPEVRIVVEVMGGTGPAREYILRALRSGKSVVTANKDIMAEHGAEVWAAAAAGGADVFFEASVGGGIPIVRAMKQSLAGNCVRRVAGILNGTTNYILTRMSREGLSLAAALAEAQAQGYAEADPSADLDGLDAARKLCILSSIAYSTRCRPAEVFRQGIRDIGPADIAYGARMGWICKLLGISELRKGAVSMRVHPAFVRREHPLAAVSDAFNAIYIQGDAIGEAMFYGRGAGSLPTASAILGDLMDAARFIDRGGSGTACTCFHQRPVEDIGAVISRFYIRLHVDDRVGVLAQIADAFGRCGVSILSVLQSPLSPGEALTGESGEGERAELIVVTHEVREDSLERAIAGLRRLASVRGVGAVIRLAPEDL